MNPSANKSEQLEILDYFPQNQNGVIRRSYSNGQTLFLQGQEAIGLYIIESGFIKIYVNDDYGNECIYSILKPGFLFGEISLIDQKLTSTNAAALGHCNLRYIPKSVFHCTLQSNPELSELFLLRLCDSVRHLSTELLNHSSGNAYQRLRKILHEMQQNHYLPYSIPIKQQDLAAFVGCSRSTLSRMLGKLKQGNYLQYDKGNLQVIATLPEQINV